MWLAFWGIKHPYHLQSKQCPKKIFFPCEVLYNSLKQCSVGLNGHTQDIVIVSVLMQMLQILRNSVGLKGVTPFATRLNLGSQPETGLTAAIYALLALTSYELRRYYLYQLCYDCLLKEVWSKNMMFFQTFGSCDHNNTIAVFLWDYIWCYSDQ